MRQCIGVVRVPSIGGREPTTNLTQRNAELFAAGGLASATAGVAVMLGPRVTGLVSFTGQLGQDKVTTYGASSASTSRFEGGRTKALGEATDALRPDPFAEKFPPVLVPFGSMPTR